MTFGIRLLGRPSIERSDGASYRLRSRKSWALLAYLVLSEAAPTRSQLAGLLFAEADDPLRALRWSLAEIRRCLGDGASLDGDPVVLRLPDDAVVDVASLTHGAWTDAVEVVGLDAELLDGLGPRRAGLRVVAALRAAPSRGRGRGRPARGGAGVMARGALDRRVGSPCARPR